jgi:hypothetical protein
VSVRRVVKRARVHSTRNDSRRVGCDAFSGLQLSRYNNSVPLLNEKLRGSSARLTPDNTHISDDVREI